MRGAMDGLKVLITGASRGIGADIAQAFSNRGAHVIGTRTKPDDCEVTNGCSEWLVADFSDIGQIYDCAKAVEKIMPDVLINNAGINIISPFESIDPEDFLLIQQVNVFAPFLLCRAALPAMKERAWGRIVNISSIWGVVGKECRASYSASKFALDGMTLALAAECSQGGILANCVAPGFTNTQLTHRVLGEDGIRQLISSVPLGRMAKTQEIADFVVWLGSRENTYITGQNIAIDGGFSRV